MLWHLVYWPALFIVGLSVIVGTLAKFTHTLADETAKYAERQIYRRKQKARR